VDDMSVFLSCLSVLMLCIFKHASLWNNLQAGLNKFSHLFTHDKWNLGWKAEISLEFFISIITWSLFPSLILDGYWVANDILCTRYVSVIYVTDTEPFHLVSRQSFCQKTLFSLWYKRGLSSLRNVVLQFCTF